MEKRIAQLDALRFFLIVTIVISHFDFLRTSCIGSIYQIYLNNPTLAVDYFFMLSGFGLFLSQKDEGIKTIRGCIGFANNKVKKIYPVYIVSMLLGLVGSLYLSISKNGIFVGILKNSLNMVFYIPMIQSFTGMETFSHSINSVAWFISTLFIIYFASPFIKHYIKKWRVSPVCKICISILFLLIISILTRRIDELGLLGGQINDLWYGHPITRIWYVILGMEVCELYTKRGCFNSKINSSIIEIICVVITIFYFFIRNSLQCDVNFVRVIDVLNCLGFLYIFSCGTGIVTNALNNPFLVRLGKDAMYIYLFHYPVKTIVDILFSELGLISLWGQNGYAFEVLFIVCITILCTVIMKHKESTLMNQLERLLLLIRKVVCMRDNRIL